MLNSSASLVLFWRIFCSSTKRFAANSLTAFSIIASSLILLSFFSKDIRRNGFSLIDSPCFDVGEDWEEAFVKDTDSSDEDGSCTGEDEEEGEDEESDDEEKGTFDADEFFFLSFEDPIFLS